MATIRNPYIFSWNDFEQTTPELERLRLALEYLPDEAIIDALEKYRGRGSNDYPVVAMWNALIAGIVFQHPSIASLVRELSRNPLLREVCGFCPMPLQKPGESYYEKDEEKGVTYLKHRPPKDPQHLVPGEHNFSRFLKNVIALEENEGLISGMTDKLYQQLKTLLPDFGEHLGYDGKAIESYSSGHLNQEKQQTSDPDADWGKHETSGVNAKTGKGWTKVKTWFGYTLHLIADTKYELPVAFRITPASHSESVELDKMIDEVFTKDPKLADTCKEFSADRGLDSGPLKQKLWDLYAIRPLIDTREMWSAEKKLPDYNPHEPIMRPIQTESVDNILHTEKGAIHCICPSTQSVKPMAFQGFESDRNTLKYRCPAAAYDMNCPGRTICETNAHLSNSTYGRVVRIQLAEQDRRMFTPTPHGSPSWKRGYNRRSALERINARIDHSFGYEVHYIRGLIKMQTRMGLSLAVMLAMAVGHMKENRPEQIRSLVKPIPIAHTG